MSAKERSLPYTELEKFLRKLSSALDIYNVEKIKELFMAAPLDFQPVDEISDIIWEIDKEATSKKVVSINSIKK